MPTQTEPKEINVHGEIYHKVDDFARKGRGKKKSSHIWKKGFEMVHVEKGTKHYYCTLCLDERRETNYKPLVINGTSSIHAHFRSKHGIDQAGNVIAGDRESTSRAATNSPGIMGFVSQFALDTFKVLLIQWIICCHIAFSQIENSYFRALITYLHSGLAQFLPTRNTIRNWVLAEFRAQKAKLKQELRRARSKIHISFDIWTSPNYYSVIAVVAHYISHDGYRRTKLLGLRTLEGRHSGENIAATVLRLIKEYKIGSRIGYFMLDNASSNDGAVDCILQSLYPWMSKNSLSGSYYQSCCSSLFIGPEIRRCAG